MANKFNWNDLEDQRLSVTKTLLINITSLRNLLRSDGIEVLNNTPTMTVVVQTLEDLSTKFTEKLKALTGGHSGKTGAVQTGQVSEYMYYAQQYNNLLVDITTALTGVHRVLVVLQENPIIQATSEPTNVH